MDKATRPGPTDGCGLAEGRAHVPLISSLPPQSPAARRRVARTRNELSEPGAPVYSCLTECPTIPQKTVPLATPMETVLAPGRGRLRGER